MTAGKEGHFAGVIQVIRIHRSVQFSSFWHRNEKTNKCDNLQRLRYNITFPTLTKV